MAGECMNKNKFFKLFCLLAVVVVFCLMAACSQPKDLRQLSAPANLRVEEGVLVWDGVENACGYMVYYKNEEFPADQPRYDLSSFASPGVYLLQVQALGDGKNYSDSDCAEYSYEVKDSQDVPSPPEESEDDDPSQVLVPTRGLTYTPLSDGSGYSVSRGSADLPEVLVIPESYNGLPVKEIGDFTNKHYFDVISNTVTREVHLPETAESIVGDGFSMFKALREIYIPKSVKVLGSSAFEKSGLQKVTFAEDSELEVLSGFSQTSITQIDIPQGVKEIGGSAFKGTPLTRIDIPEGRTQLVAHGVNYGAFVDPNENGILFAVLGLTGGYMGGFTVKPYYDIINTYNNIENRDIWEFHLNLTSRELDFFVAHLWELGHTQTRYFFFTENCSYMLMEFLDAVRPTLKLADTFPAQTIPLDTLKAVYQTDLIDRVQYRPSRQRRIAERYRHLTSNEKKELLNYLETLQLSPQFTPTQQAAILETAYEFIQYQWTEGKTDLKTYRRQTFKTLQNRTKLNTPSTPPAIQMPSPLTAHHSARITLAQGFERGNSFQEIQIRPAYHALTDRPNGLLNGSEINFLNTNLRYYDALKQLSLQQLQLVEITSLSPWNALFHPFSYTIKTGINRNWNPKTNTYGYTYDLSGGTGLTIELTPKLYAFFLGETGMHYGGFLPHNLGINIGAKTGIVGYFNTYQLLIEAERLFSDNWYLNQTNIRFNFTYNLAQNLGLSATYILKDIHPHSNNTFTVGLNYFF